MNNSPPRMQFPQDESPFGGIGVHRRSSAVSKIFLPLVAVATITSCAIGPNYEKPAVETPQAFKEASGEWVVAKPLDNVPKGEWWKIFKDPVLDGLMEQV